MPRILNKHHGNIPKDAVYVGRPTYFGNPFVIGRDGTRAEVIEKYRHWVQTSSHPDATHVRAVIHTLRGKDLVCWCAPAPCHADILLELANA